MSDGTVHLLELCAKEHNHCTMEFMAIESELEELWIKGIDPGEYTQTNELIRATFLHDLRTPGTGFNNSTSIDRK